MGVTRPACLVRAEPVAERAVFDRNRVTGGGVTAGIDFALALTAVIRGEDYARFAQLSLEYDPRRPSTAARPSVSIRRRSPATVMVEQRAPGRAAKVQQIAARLQD